MSLEYELNVENIIQRLEIAHNPKQAIIRGQFFEAEYTFFLENIKNSNILVAGSGLGHDSFELAQYNKQVIGIELLKPLVILAKKEAEVRGLKNIIFEQGDFTNLSFPNNHFDASVLNMGTISNFEDKRKVLEELLRVSTTVYFDFYPPSQSSLKTRRQLYTQELWKNVRIKDNSIISDDGLYSNSLCIAQVDNITDSLNAKVNYYPLTEYAMMAKIVRK